jgi:hypothetical protein
MVDFKPNANFDTAMGVLAKGFLRRKAVSTVIAAKFYVGDEAGRLKSTIRADRPTKAAGTESFEVHVRSGGERAPYALAHHEGYAPFKHVSDGDVMVFPSKGGIVYTREIDHPGFPGNPYMVKALRSTMAETGATVKRNF